MPGSRDANCDKRGAKEEPRCNGRDVAPGFIIGRIGCPQRDVVAALGSNAHRNTAHRWLGRGYRRQVVPNEPCPGIARPVPAKIQDTGLPRFAAARQHPEHEGLRPFLRSAEPPDRIDAVYLQQDAVNPAWSCFEQHMRRATTCGDRFRVLKSGNEASPGQNARTTGNERHVRSPVWHGRRLRRTESTVALVTSERRRDRCYGLAGPSRQSLNSAIKS